MVRNYESLSPELNMGRYNGQFSNYDFHCSTQNRVFLQKVTNITPHGLRENYEFDNL